MHSASYELIPKQQFNSNQPFTQSVPQALDANGYNWLSIEAWCDEPFMTGESAVVTIEHANVNEDDAYTALTSITFDDNPATGFSPQIVTQSGYARFLRAKIEIFGFSLDVIRTIRVNLLLKESV